jgi:hypothetical protein
LQQKKGHGHLHIDYGQAFFPSERVQNNLPELSKGFITQIKALPK